MRIATVILPVLLGLAAVPALAQPAASSGRGQDEMSYSDYLAQRARLLLRMKGENPQQQQAAPDAANAERQEGRYGEGYASRREAQARTAPPPQHRRGRIVHPRAEHLQHPLVERPERPHIERPERPGRP
jgi:hypothetical protein